MKPPPRFAKAKQVGEDHCIAEFLKFDDKFEVNQVHRFDLCQNYNVHYNELENEKFECEASIEEAESISLICKPKTFSGKVIFPINELLRIFPVK